MIGKKKLLKIIKLKIIFEKLINSYSIVSEIVKGLRFFISIS